MHHQTPTRSSSLGNSQARSDQVGQMASQELMNEVKALKMEVQGLKRTIGDMAGQQSELLRLVKSLKKAMMQVVLTWGNPAILKMLTEYRHCFIALTDDIHWSMKKKQNY